MGRHSNIILLNNSSKIIDSMRHLEISSNSTRDILPARNYLFPATEKNSFVNLNSFEEFYELISPFIGKEPIDLLISSHFTGISKLLISHLLETYSIENDSTIRKDYITIYNGLRNLLFSDIEATPYSFQNKEDYVVKIAHKKASNINTFLDNFYNKKEQKIR